MENLKTIIKDDFYLRIPRFSTDVYNIYHGINDDEIMKFYKNKFSEEILVESKDFFKSCELKIQDTKKLANTLRKYIIRSSTRCTPFGLNAAVLHGRFEKNSNLIIDTNKYQKDANIDYQWYIALVDLLEKKIGKNLNVILNNTIEINENWIINRWIDSYKNNLITGESIVLNNTNALKKIFYKIKDNFFSLNYLINYLKSIYPNVDSEIIESFLRELLDNQIIVSDLKINTLSSRDLKILINKLERYKCDNFIVQELLMISELLEVYNNTSLGQGTEIYLKLINLMKKLVKSDNYICVDLYNNTHINLDYKLKDDLNQYINLLISFSNECGYEKEYFDKFIDHFGNQAVSVYKAFDNCLGIGLPVRRKFAKDEKYDKLEKYIIENYSDSIDLNNLMKTIKSNENLQLSSVELSFNYVKISDKPYLICNQLLGSNQAYKIMGRFQRFKSNYSILDHNETLVEIVYFPKKCKISNVLNCNTSAKYYLEYGSHYDIDNMERIYLDDIYIVPLGNKLKFINKKTNQSIKFIVSNMVNVSFMPPLLQALLIISENGNTNLFNLFVMLNRIFSNHSMRPEIKYNNIILQTRTIHISEKDNVKISPKNIRSFLRSNYVLCGNNDNYMLLDLKEKSNIDILNKLLKTEKVLNIKESFYDEKNNSLVDEYDKSYLSEFIFEVFFHNNNITSKNNKIKFMTNSTYLSDNDMWISFKLYMEKDFMNYFIKEYIYKIIEGNVDHKLIKKYFFVKYFDTDYHIRFRVLMDKNKFDSKINIMNLYQNFIKLREKGIIKAVVIDEYIPEINRYGGIEVMNDIETIFMLSSAICITLMTHLHLSEKKQLENQYFNFVITHILHSYEDIDDQIKLMSRFSKYYKRENSYEKIKKNIINTIIHNEVSICDVTNNVLHVDENKKISILLNKVKCQINNDEIFNEVLISIFHMHFNRTIGINRALENKLNSLVENTLYSIKGIRKQLIK